MDPTSAPSSELYHAILFLIPVAVLIGLFTLLAVVGVARERRREREALYRHETARKLIEAKQMTFEQFAEIERAEAERPIAARRAAFAMTGAALLLGGLALYYACVEMDPHVAPDLALDELAFLTLVPAAIGLALLLTSAASAVLAAAKVRLGRRG